MNAYIGWAVVAATVPIMLLLVLATQKIGKLRNLALHILAYSVDIGAVLTGFTLGFGLEVKSWWWVPTGENVSSAPRVRPAPVTQTHPNRNTVSTAPYWVGGKQMPTLRKSTNSKPTSDVPRSQQKILDSLAYLASIGIAQPSRTQLALWAGVSPTSGGYFNNLGSLRTAGLIDYPSGGTVVLTDAGAAAAQAIETPSTEEMQTALFAKVGAPKAAILRALIDIYPKEIAREDLAERIGVSPTSGGYFNNLGALRTLGVIDYPTPRMVAALPVLFL